MSVIIKRVLTTVLSRHNVIFDGKYRIFNRKCSVFTNRLESANSFHDYETEKSKFEMEVPEDYNFATDVIDQWASKEELLPEISRRPAFWWVDEFSNEEKWTFKELSVKSKLAAMLLQRMCGIEEGNRVLVILPRIPQWWLINIACIRIGAVLIPGTTQLTPRDIASRISRANIDCIIGDDSVVQKMKEVEKYNNQLPKCKIMISRQRNSRFGWQNFNTLFKLAEKSQQSWKPVKNKSSDLMTIFFTSGTTGLPKMACHSHASYAAASLITGRFWLDLTPSDIHWNLSDTGWAKSAWSSLFAPWVQGATVFVYQSTNFEVAEILKILQTYPVTTFCAAPTAYRMLVQGNMSNFKSDVLRHCITAGEPMNPAVMDEWFKLTGIQLREGYGQTETVLLVGAFRCLENKPGSMGKPAPGFDVQIIDDDGNIVAPGKEGDIAVRVKPNRPVGLFSEYMNDEQRTARCFKGDYYLTGDRAMMDADGYFWFVGRADDVILSGGYCIGPFEVESALMEHAAVAESAVVSCPDDTRGEIVKAFVVLTQLYRDRDHDVLRKDIQNHVKRVTAPYKYPRQIEFVDSLPKTVSGKIRRVELRNNEWSK